MRFVLYNIRYATGGGRNFSCAWDYFLKTGKNLERISAFLKSQRPDIVGLVEVDAGSYRSGRKNQAEMLADSLGHFHSYACKYAEDHAATLVPVLNRQGNAFLTRNSFTQEKFHYFDSGMKRLVIELDLNNLTIFLVHLSLTSKIRHRQLNDLYGIVKKTKKPHIVAGDFNAMWGDREIQLFLAATGLINSDSEGNATYPSWKPKRQLDFILHSTDISVRGFKVPQVRYSDHYPLVCDLELNQAPVS